MGAIEYSGRCAHGAPVAAHGRIASPRLVGMCVQTKPAHAYIKSLRVPGRRHAYRSHPHAWLGVSRERQDIGTHHASGNHDRGSRRQRIMHSVCGVRHGARPLARTLGEESRSLRGWAFWEDAHLRLSSLGTEHAVRCSGRIADDARTVYGALRWQLVLRLAVVAMLLCGRTCRTGFAFVARRATHRTSSHTEPERDVRGRRSESVRGRVHAQVRTVPVDVSRVERAGDPFRDALRVRGRAGRRGCDLTGDICTPHAGGMLGSLLVCAASKGFSNVALGREQAAHTGNHRNGVDTLPR